MIGYRVAQVGMVFILACAKSAHVFRSSLTHFVDFVFLHYNNSSSDSKLFYVSLRSQALL